MKKIFVTIPDGEVKETFLPQSVRNELEKNFCTQYNTTCNQLSRKELIDAISDVDAVLTGWGTPMLDAEVLGKAGKLKLIVHTGGTVGNLVDDFAFEHGITVLSGNKIYAESVAEGTLSYILMAQRRIPQCSEYNV